MKLLFRGQVGLSEMEASWLKINPFVLCLEPDSMWLAFNNSGNQVLPLTSSLWTIIWKELIKK